MKKGKLKFSKKNRTLYIVIGAVVVVVAGMGIFSTVSGGAQDKGAATEGTVEAITVENGDVASEVSTSGTVISNNKKTFYSPVNATIESMNFKNGDSVISGTSLITFNLEDLEEQNQKAELTAKASDYGYKDTIKKSDQAAADQAEAEALVPVLKKQAEDLQNYINALQNGMTSTVQEGIANDTERVNGEIGALQKQLADLEADPTVNSYIAQETAVNAQIAAAQADLEKLITHLANTSGNSNYSKEEIAQKEAERDKKEAEIQSLEGQLSGIRIQIDNWSMQLYGYTRDSKSAEIEQKQAELSAVGADPTVYTSDAEQKLAQAQADLAEVQAELSRNETIAEADSAVLSPEAKKQLEINNNLQELEGMSLEELIAEGRKGIQAEFTGVISDAQITDEATVTQGMPLFTLHSTEDVSIQVSLAKGDYEKVKEGQKADITLAGNKYQGTVTKISRLAVTNEAGKTSIQAEVHIDNPDENIFLGVDAKVNIHAAEAKNVPLLPTEAVNIGKDGSFCYVVEDGVLTRKTIETGVSSDNEVEIVSGVKAGDKVVEDIGNYQEGDPVTVTDASETEEGADAANSEE